MNPKKAAFSIGLDIGTQAVKIVKLKFNKDAAELEGVDLLPAQPELMEALKQIRAALNTSGPVNVAVSGPSTVIRYVNFPKMNAAELKNALKFEAQKHLPFSVSEVNLDGFSLKEGLADNKMLVLVAAVKKEFLNPRLKLIEDAGFKVGLVDIDSLAIINAFNFNYSLQDNPDYTAIALLNVGASLSSLNILENGIPRLSRDIHISGNNFTQKIMDAMAVDIKAAEALKLNPAAEQAQKLGPAVEPVINNLVTEIRTSFDYFESQSTSSVSRIFLSGGGSLFSGLKDSLAAALGTSVEYWDPFKKITSPAGIDSSKVKNIAVSLAVAVGLALRR
ncbi:MAG: type IV pilus assembly protein PilM [Candidatus Omnitrophota bacterium]